jgi:hypothetical protein
MMGKVFAERVNEYLAMKGYETHNIGTRHTSTLPCPTPNKTSSRVSCVCVCVCVVCVVCAVCLCACVCRVPCVRAVHRRIRRHPVQPRTVQAPGNGDHARV